MQGDAGEGLGGDVAQGDAGAQGEMAGGGGDAGVEIVGGEEDGGALLVGEDGAGGDLAGGCGLRLGGGVVVGGGGWGAVAFEEDLALGGWGAVGCGGGVVWACAVRLARRRARGRRRGWVVGQVQGVGLRFLVLSSQFSVGTDAIAGSWRDGERRGEGAFSF